MRAHQPLRRDAAPVRSGRPLPPRAIGRIQPIVRFDLRDIRVHADAEADAAARRAGARAFTVGSDISFAAGEYAPETPSGMRLIAHEVAHTRQRGAAHTLRRVALTAPRFAGNTDLQRARDNVNLLESGNAGEGVRLLQQALIDLGTPLLTGSDGEFGAQTKAAVKAYQRSKGLTGTDVDGRVGPTTMGLLDADFAAPSAATVPGTPAAAAATDFQIDRVGTSSQRLLFFGRSSAVLTPGATARIAAIKGAAPASVSLIGFTSGDEVGSLAQSRADAVRTALEAAPNAVTVTSAVGNPGAASGQLDYADARKVEVVPAGGASTTLDCDARDGAGNLINPPTASCATLDPATDTAFTTSLAVALDALTRTLAVLGAPLTAADQALLDRFFHDHSAATVTDLRSRLTRLHAHVAGLAAITRCGAQCDRGGCDSGALAYNNGVDAASRMTLCVPAFKGLTTEYQAVTLIHESAHGTSGLGLTPGRGTVDLAYDFERMLFQLSTAQALRNSDSLAMYPVFLREERVSGVAGASPAGVVVPPTDTPAGFVNAGEWPATQLALATAEKRISWAKDHTGQLRGEASRVRAGTRTWATTWARAYMTQAARYFPLTAPPVTPTAADLDRLAAMRERYRMMRAGIRQNLTITRGAAGNVAWAAAGDRAAAAFSVGPGFFAAVPGNRVNLLVEALAGATSGVEATYLPAYVAWAAWVHNQAT